MRKFSFLTFAIVACFLTVAASASAASRYAYPDGDATNIATCGPAENCDLTSAMDTAVVADSTKIIVAPGTYTVATPLVISALDSGLQGDGETAADVVINSTVTGSPALTLNNQAEAEGFTLNTVTTGGTSGGLNVVSGHVNQVSVTASGSDYANACTGRNARFVNTLCRGTGTFASAFRTYQATDIELTFLNSTLIPGPYGYGFAGTTLTDDNEMRVEMISTIIVSGSGHPILLGRPSTGIPSIFTAEYSNYECTQIVLDQVSGQDCLAPVGTGNQTEAPIFKDPDNGDFTAATDSPTVDAGLVSGLTGSKDLLGKSRVQGAAIDIGALESTPSVVVTPPVGGNPIVPPVAIPDTIKPKLTITKKPKSKTASKKLRVTFKANETASFRCKLDKGKFKSCKSPYKKSVKVGKHKLQIKATDAAGNVSSVKTISWKVKKK